MDECEAVARAAVAEVSPRLRAAWRAPKRIEHKGAIDLVTETDREVEAIITARLRRAFPDHLIVAEEASAAGGAARPPADRYAWYLDPIDGTTNFAHGYPHFAVSLGFARGADLLFGLVHDPVRDETFAARRSAGATLNGAPLRVSAVADLEQALLGTGFPYDARTYIDEYLQLVGDFVRSAQGVRRVGSAALDLVHVACGRFDGFWEWKLRPWDTAAGVLIVREAGGTVTDFRGGPFDLYGTQTLATNGSIHAAMLAVLGKRLDASA